MFLARTLSLSILLALVACTSSSNSDSVGGAPPVAPNGPVASAEPDQAAPSHTMKAKYKSAVLVCDVRLQHGREFDPTSPPTETQAWDVLNEFAPSRSLKYIEGISNMTVSVLINVVDVQFVDKHVDDAGKGYELQSSPELSIELYDAGRVVLASGANADWQVNAKPSVMHEKLVSTLVNRTQTDPKSGDGLRYFENVTCLLDTEILPAYASQFKTVP